MKATENIEKAIRGPDLGIDTNAEANKVILSELLEAQQKSKNARSAATEPSIVRRIIKSPISKYAAAAVVILAAFIRITWLSGPADEPGETTPKHRVASTLDAELDEVRQMGRVGDVKGLAAMLLEGQFESKIVAANFLAKMGKMPALTEMPALETLSMHAGGELIVNIQAGNVGLCSTKCEDRLEIAAGILRVHTTRGTLEADRVRLTYDIRGDDETWEQRQREFENLRLQRADLESRLAELGRKPAKDIEQLRKRLAKYNELLDGMDEAVYISLDNNRLKLDCPSRRRTAFAEPRDGVVRVEWHGHIVEADRVTLLLGLAPVRTDGAPAPVPGWRARFDKVYSLDEGQVLRWVRYPFIGERQIYATQEMPYHASKNPPPPGYIAFQWDGTLHPWVIAMHECSLGSVLSAIGLKRYEIGGSEELLGLKLGGDWIIRKDAPTDEVLCGLEVLIEDGLGRQIRFEKQGVNRDAIIVRGQYKHVPLEGVKRPKKIYVYPDSWEDFSGPEPYAGGGTGSLTRLIETIGSHFDRPIVFETQNLSEITVSYFMSQSYDLAIANVKTEESRKKILDSVLKNLSKQTSLEFEYGQSDQDVWLVTERDKTD